MKFKLPEENGEFNLYHNGPTYYDILWEFDQWLRTQIKHNNKNEFQEVRDQLWDLLDEEDVKL
jgi:hypothetical protein